MVLLNGNQIETSYNHSQAAHHLSHQHLFQQINQDHDTSRQASADLSNIYHLKRCDFYFMSDELRSEIIRKNLLLLATPSQDLAIRKFFISEKINAIYSSFYTLKNCHYRSKNIKI